ncbi:MAG: sigma-70 family RNA polymerase sigma factor [candidate division Zixibacteria bacterium]|jgi:RNA polymerase sigma factor (TIGR02999 family)|nr:sigma-70 family RNA polymerase sigma factor [candidate division Zixibacteria bacterium]
MEHVTVLLNKISEGNESAVNTLLPLVYDELRKLAQWQLRGERSDHTLNATAIVHEAYLKLVDQRNVTWQNRAHFMAIAAQAMRRILIDYARTRQAEKRGGGQPVVTLNEELMQREARAEELILLDQALDKLREHDERQSKVVEYHFFAGLTHEEVAEVLKVSVATVRRDWRLARAWLSVQLGEG